MSLRTDLVAHLKGNAGLATVMAAGGLHPGVAAQNTDRPYITYNRIGDAAEHFKTGAAPLSQAVWQFDCWADTALTLDATSEALRGAIDGWMGDMGGTDVRHIRVDNEYDGIEQPDDGREAAIYRSTFTVTIWYVRAVPAL